MLTPVGSPTAHLRTVAIEAELDQRAALPRDLSNRTRTAELRAALAERAAVVDLTAFDLPAAGTGSDAPDVMSPAAGLDPAAPESTRQDAAHRGSHPLDNRSAPAAAINSAGA